MLALANKIRHFVTGVSLSVFLLSSYDLKPIHLPKFLKIGDSLNFPGRQILQGRGRLTK